MEVVWTLRLTGQLVWPASAMLTGSGVALIFRVLGTERGDHWSLARLVPVRACRRRIAADQICHSAPRLPRLQSFQRRSGPGFLASGKLQSGAPRLLVGSPRRLDGGRLRNHPGRGSADHCAVASPGHGGDVLVDLGGRTRPAGRFGPLHDGSLVAEPGVRASLLVGGGDIAGNPHISLFHDHRPKDDSDGIRCSSRICGVPGGGVHPVDRSSNDGIRSQGGATCGPGGDDSGSPLLRPPLPSTRRRRGPDQCHSDSPHHLQRS